MRRLTFLFLIALGGTAAGLAQSINEVPWARDVKQAIALAQRTKRPLLFYVTASREDRDNNLEHAQARAMADPKVQRWMHQFVLVRLSRSANRDILEQVGLHEAANMEMSFTAPDGKKLDTLSAGGVAQKDSLLRKLQLVFNAYGQMMFDSELRPILVKQDATPKELREPLQRIQEFHITGADTYVAQLLDRAGLDKQTTDLCYAVLAALSTKASVDKLVERSGQNDRAATAALAKCTPAGAQLMLAHLVDKEGFIRLDVYKAVMQICGMKDRKSDRWWEQAKENSLRDEIERVKREVTEVAEQWKRENE